MSGLEESVLSWLSWLVADRTFDFYVVTFGFGLAIGVSELVSRYKDSPMHALLTRPALLYVGLNGAASLGALALVRLFGWMDDAGGGDPTKRLVLQSLASGFGAMGVFRTSLFTVRVGNADIGVGPVAFLQIMLSAADRACDRILARPRASDVQDIMSDVSFARAKQALPSLCFALMQNVSSEEQEAFSTAVIKLEKAEMEDLLKAYSLGLVLMNVVGKDVLKQAVNILRDDISVPPRQMVQSIATLQLLRTTRFDSARQIIDSCTILTRKTSDAALAAALAKVLEKIDAMTVGEPQKVLYLTTDLIGRFGEDVVRTVLQALPENDRGAGRGDNK